MSFDRTTVLIVDDEPAIRLSVAAKLSQAGYKVLEADSVQAARKESGPGARSLGLSIGVAYAKSEGADLEGLLKLADLAMYEAKHRGGDRVVAAHDRCLADIVPIRPIVAR